MREDDLQYGQPPRFQEPTGDEAGILGRKFLSIHRFPQEQSRRRRFALETTSAIKFTRSSFLRDPG